MAGASTAAVLYASVISTTQVLGGEPEDVKELRHHVKVGGFTNPWESFVDKNGFAIGYAMIM